MRHQHTDRCKSLVECFKAGVEESGRLAHQAMGQAKKAVKTTSEQFDVFGTASRTMKAAMERKK